MEEGIQEGRRAGYRGIELGWPSTHDAVGGHAEIESCELILPQKWFHHSKVVGSNPAPAAIAKEPSFTGGFFFLYDAALQCFIDHCRNRATCRVGNSYSEAIWRRISHRR